MTFRILTSFTNKKYINRNWLTNQWPYLEWQTPQGVEAGHHIYNPVGVSPNKVDNLCQTKLPHRVAWKTECVTVDGGDERWLDLDGQLSHLEVEVGVE